MSLYEITGDGMKKIVMHENDKKNLLEVGLIPYDYQDYEMEY